MKNIYSSFLIPILLLLVAGCSDSMLDFQPKDRYTEGNFWTTESSADRYLTSCYASLRGSGLYGGDATPLFEETASPNAYNNSNTSSWNAIAVGLQSGSTGGILTSRWSHAYGGIGRCNTLIRRIEDVPMNEALKERMIGEAMFLRALYYFNLTTYWGDVPLILDPPNPATQTRLPRTSRSEVIEQILDDLNRAAAILPVQYSTNDLGRATKGAAMALKAKVLLFEASPLFNTARDQQKWGEAAVAAAAVMDMANEAGYALYRDYRGLFLPENENNDEVIFDVQFIFPFLGNSFDLINMQYNTNAPTLSLVNAYEMKNGRQITDPASGYDPNNPYADRDPRLDATVVYPGSRYMGTVVSETRFAITGFGLRKYGIYTEDAPPAEYSDLKAGQSFTNYMVLRYADILLMYAEAQNEFSGPDASVYNAIDAVRNRVDMPAVSRNLSQNELRELIRRERRVEFAGEGYYYNDIRRWMTAETVMNEGVYTWDNKIIEERNFNPDRDYWWPITDVERDLNPELEQNPEY